MGISAKRAELAYCEIAELGEEGLFGGADLEAYLVDAEAESGPGGEVEGVSRFGGGDGAH